MSKQSTIHIFGASAEKREHLKSTIKAGIKDMDWQLDVKFLCHAPDEVFYKPLHKKAWAAFFVVESMYDMEAARKLGFVRVDIPVVLISDDDEYCPFSYNLATTRYYLEWPSLAQEIKPALKHCVKPWPWGNFSRYAYHVR